MSVAFAPTTFILHLATRLVPSLVVADTTASPSEIAIRLPISSTVTTLASVVFHVTVLFSAVSGKTVHCSWLSLPTSKVNSAAPIVILSAIEPIALMFISFQGYVFL